MNSFLCIFGPSFVGLILIYMMNNGKNRFTGLLINYFVNALVTNFFMQIIVIKFFGIVSNIENTLESFPGFACKYILIACFLSVIFSLIMEVIEKNIHLNVEVEVKKDEKKDK